MTGPPEPSRAMFALVLAQDVWWVVCLGALGAVVVAQRLERRRARAPKPPTT